MKRLSHRNFLFVFILYSLLGFVQNAVGQSIIESRVVTLEGEALSSASAILLNEADSVMVSFALADNRGRILIENVKEGQYLVHTSFLGYLDQYTSVLIDGSKRKITLDDIVMREGEMKLDEVIIVSDHIPVRINKDTIRYNAAAFKVGPNAAVEDLLKRLPGIEVSKDGSIKAQGEDVQKILVEGKEFFGNDPTIATKNLPADAVANVEVFDKKSEMAEFSGIDDGMEQKTINLSLKEDRKKAIFGNGEAGLGSEDRYEAKFNMNSFKGDATWTALGMANNINEQGFSVMDYIDFMGGLGSFMSGGGRVEINSDDLGIPIGEDLGQGFVNTISGGINYNNDLGENTELSGSYFYNSMDNDVSKRTTRENLFGDESFFTDEMSQSRFSNKGHSLNLQLQSKMDTTQRLTVRGNFGWSSNDSRSSLMRTLMTADQVENALTTENDRTGDRLSFGINGTYSMRLGRKGRILSLNSRLNNRNSTSDALINSINSFYSEVPMPILDSLMQRQDQHNDAMDYVFGMSYTEPLGRSQYLELNFNHQNVRNDFAKDFYDIVFRPQQTESFNDELSDFFDRQFLYNRFGLNYKLNRKDYNFTLGVNLQNSDQQGNIGDSEDEITRDYFSVLPLVRFAYDFGGARNLRVDYFTNIREPSLEELQPQLDNSDPLYLYQGNPDLDPEYRHALNINYHSFNSFSFVTFFTGVNVSYTTDKITNAQFIDDNFVQTIMPVNVQNEMNTSAYASFSTPIRPLGMKMELSSDVRFAKGRLFLNGIENNTTNWNNRYTLIFENRIKEKWDWLIGTTVGFNSRKYSESEHLDQNFFKYNYYTDISKDIGEDWRFETSFDYTIFPEQSFGSATDLALWRASVSTNFLKNKKGRLTFGVVDILDQNKGINRSSSLNYLQDQRVVSLGRYAMLTFTYSFSGFGKKDDGVIQVKTRRRRG